MFIEHKSIRLAMLVILLASVNLSGILSGWLLSRGEYTGIILAELVAVLAAGFVLSESKPRTRYYWPPRSRGALRRTAEALRPAINTHPCRQLLDMLLVLIDNNTKENRQQVTELMAECDEPPMVATAQTVMKMLDEPGDATLELWNSNGDDDEH